MTSPLKPWESTNGIPLLQSSSPNPVIPQIGNGRNLPYVPPRPFAGGAAVGTSNYSPYSPYPSSYNSYGSFGSPYRSSMMGYGYGGGYNNNSYGYGNYGMYGMDNYSQFGPRDDAERRFIQFAEESSRNTFSNVEGIVRAVNSLSMMLDNTFFAMTSSFRAVLSVAENFGRLRTMFGHIWYSVSIFRLFRWLYRKIMQVLGYKVARSATSLAWNEAYTGVGVETAGGAPGRPNWATLAFLGVLMSAPYFISKFLLPKYEDKYNPEKWKTPGIQAKAAFNFVATTPNELSLDANDELLLAPTYIQEEMKLLNSGWAFAIGNGKSGLVPLNYLVLKKKPSNGGVLKTPRVFGGPQFDATLPPVPRSETKRTSEKNGLKRVSFGENQIIESVDLPAYKSFETETPCVKVAPVNAELSCQTQNSQETSSVETDSCNENIPDFDQVASEVEN